MAKLDPFCDSETQKSLCACARARVRACVRARVYASDFRLCALNRGHYVSTPEWVCDNAQWLCVYCSVSSVQGGRGRGQRLGAGVGMAVIWWW